MPKHRLEQKRTYESETGRPERRIVRPLQAKEGQGTIAFRPGEEQQPEPFSRETILRLIEWIKQV